MLIEFCDPYRWGSCNPPIPGHHEVLFVHRSSIEHRVTIVSRGVREELALITFKTLR